MELKETFRRKHAARTLTSSLRKARGRMSRERSWTRLDDNLDFFKIFQNLFPFFTFVFLTLLTGALLMDDGSALSWPQSSKTW